MVARVYEELEIVLYLYPKDIQKFQHVQKKFLAIRDREFIRIESALVHCNSAIAVIEFPPYARLLAKINGGGESPAEH